MMVGNSVSASKGAEFENRKLCATRSATALNKVSFWEARLAEKNV